MQTKAEAKEARISKWTKLLSRQNLSPEFKKQIERNLAEAKAS